MTPALEADVLQRHRRGQVVEAPGVALGVEGLSFRYGRRQALADVAFTVEAGSATLVLGPNGAGKTTLFSLIAGLFRPDSGRVAVAGRAVGGTSAALGPLGVVFQQQTLDLDLTVRQNLRYAAALRGLSRREADAAIERELAALDMTDRAGEKVRALNGGHRRRVEIARALLHRPAVLLLDEPTVGLDIPTRAALIEHLHGRVRGDGVALLWATHLLDEVWPGDRIVVLSGGRVAAAGPVDDVVASVRASSLAEAFARLTRPEGGAT